MEESFQRTFVATCTRGVTETFSHKPGFALDINRGSVRRGFVYNNVIYFEFQSFLLSMPAPKAKSTGYQGNR